MQVLETSSSSDLPSIHRTLSFSSESSVEASNVEDAGGSDSNIDKEPYKDFRDHLIEECFTPNHITSDEESLDTAPSTPKPSRPIKSRLVFPESLWLPFD
jgi:hypothetical protein